MGNPTVSVIMPAFNAEKTIVDSIRSVVQQTYPDWQLIIVDDASADGTIETASEFLDDPRVNLIRVPKNSGMSHSRNLGASESTGEFLAFLDSDDLWAPRKLELQVKLHATRLDFHISHTAFDEFDYAGKHKTPWRQLVTPSKKKRGELLPALYYNNIIGTLTVMMKRSLFERMNGFNSELFAVEDHDLWLRVAEGGFSFGYIDEVLASYRFNPTGASKRVEEYENSVTKFIDLRILNDKRIPISVKRRVQGAHFLMFGRLHSANGDFIKAERYLARAVVNKAFNCASLVASILFLIQNTVQIILGWFHLKVVERNP
jgi:glycosyltransferase involved in cell wall biosynthesis